MPFDPGHAELVRKHARSIREALEDGAPGAAAVTRCYQHEQAEIEAKVRAIYAEELTAEQLAKVRLVFVAFEALVELAPVVITAGRGGVVELRPPTAEEAWQKALDAVKNPKH